jgi:hypothetical protein
VASLITYRTLYIDEIHRRGTLARLYVEVIPVPVFPAKPSEIGTRRRAVENILEFLSVPDGETGRFDSMDRRIFGDRNPGRAEIVLWSHTTTNDIDHSNSGAMSVRYWSVIPAKNLVKVWDIKPL